MTSSGAAGAADDCVVASGAAGGHEGGRVDEAKRETSGLTAWDHLMTASRGRNFDGSGCRETSEPSRRRLRRQHRPDDGDDGLSPSDRLSLRTGPASVPEPSRRRRNPGSPSFGVRGSLSSNRGSEALAVAALGLRSADSGAITPPSTPSPASDLGPRTPPPHVALVKMRRLRRLPASTVSEQGGQAVGGAAASASESAAQPGGDPPRGIGEEIETLLGMRPARLATIGLVFLGLAMVILIHI